MNKRNEGIDLLRCLSMLMVVVLHLFNHGGVNSALTKGSTGYNASYLVYILFLCAVNCYALISGYVGVTARHRWRNILSHWLVVVFYAVLLTLVVPLVVPDVAVRPLIAACTPVIHRFYWYFTAYFALFFLMPLLNKGVLAMSRSEAKRMVLSVVAVFSVLATLPLINLSSSFTVTDVFQLNDGLSVIWLAVMYIVGASIKVHGFGTDIPSWKLWLGVIVSTLAAWMFKLVVEQDVPLPTRELLDANALRYNFSPTMVVSGCCLLLLFSRWRTLPVCAGKAVRWAAPSAFSVYLIHEHSMVRSGLISGRYAAFAADAPLLLIGKVLGCAVLIYVACTLLDAGRRLLFRLLHLQQAIDWAAARVHAAE